MTLPQAADTSARETKLLRETARAFPAVTSVRVRDALDSIAKMVEQLAFATRGAASIALLASVLVLAGALAAGQDTRLYDAVVLKTLGATRGRLLKALLIEYGLIGLATAVFGVLAGIGAAFFIITSVMKLPFVLLWGNAILAASAALAVTIILGLAGTWRVLGQKPAPYLRNL
jgi:putative ABC transport system permease protein